MRGWIGLHRPDGEVVRIKTDQIVYVMSAANTGADKRALSRIQLLDGFADVRENVDEVMLAIKNDDFSERDLNLRCAGNISPRRRSFHRDLRHPGKGGI
jgi:hypothetical protein